MQLSCDSWKTNPLDNCTDVYPKISLVYPVNVTQKLPKNRLSGQDNCTDDQQMNVGLSGEGSVQALVNRV